MGQQTKCKEKVDFYGYLIITPVLVAVCIVLVIYNYNNQINKVLEKDISGINTLSESINVLQTEIKISQRIYALMAILMHS